MYHPSLLLTFFSSFTDTIHVFLHVSLSFLPYLLPFIPPSLPSPLPLPYFLTFLPSFILHPFYTTHFHSESKMTVAVNGLFNNTNQLKFCLVQDSEPSTEQVAHVKSKNKSPTSVLGLPLLRHPEKKRNFLFLRFSFYLFKAEHTVKFRK